MYKNKYWELDNEDTLRIHKIKAKKDAIEKEPVLELFEFEVKRYKDKNSKIEQLEICAKVQSEEYGQITTNLAKLSKDLLRFKAYGVVISNPKGTELCRLITDNYYTFEPIEKNIDYYVSDEIGEQVFHMLCKYIYDNNTEPDTIKNLKLYNIPIRDFDNEIASGEYRRYRLLDIKEKLCEKGYTCCNKGKYDYVIKHKDGSTEKMLSIYEHRAKDILDKISMEEK